MITKKELEVLLIIFGLLSIPNKLCCKLSFANNAKEPPLCSKNAQKIIEKAINIKAAINFFDL